MINSKNLKPITKMDKLLKSFLDSPLKEIKPIISTEVYDTRRWSVAEDGLPDRDTENKGVPSLLDAEDWN